MNTARFSRSWSQCQGHSKVKYLSAAGGGIHVDAWASKCHGYISFLAIAFAFLVRRTSETSPTTGLRQLTPLFKTYTILERRHSLTVPKLQNANEIYCSVLQFGYGRLIRSRLTALYKCLMRFNWLIDWLIERLFDWSPGNGFFATFAGVASPQAYLEFYST